MESSSSSSPIIETPKQDHSNLPRTLNILNSILLCFTNPTLTIFIFLTCLPLFPVVFLHELNIQHTLLNAADQFMVVFYETSGNPLLRAIYQEMFYNFVDAGMVYSTPSLLLNFLIAVSIVHTSYMVYTRTEPAGLLDMIRESWDHERYKNATITFIYMSILGILLLCLASRYIASINMVLLAIWVIIIIILMVKLWEFSALWNMGVVISILEDRKGIEAILEAAHISRGNRIAGTVLMYVDLMWWFGLVLASLLIRGNGVYALGNSGFWCMGKVMKWVIFMMYYCDCKAKMVVWRRLLTWKSRKVLLYLVQKLQNQYEGIRGKDITEEKRKACFVFFNDVKITLEI